MKKLSKLLLTIIILALILASIFYGKTPIIHYLIPESYTGWVIVSYLQKDCKSDGKEQGVVNILISDNGVGCSDQIVNGDFIRTRWLVINDAGNQIGEYSSVTWRSNKKGIWAHAILAKDKTGLLKEYFYVGTELELNRDWDRLPNK